MTTDPAAHPVAEPPAASAPPRPSGSGYAWIAPLPETPLSSRDRSAIAVRALAEAALLGILGNAVLRTGPWGINFAIWGVALCAATVSLARRHRDTLPGDAILTALGAAFFAAAFAWRDSEPLSVYNFLAFLVSLALLATALGQRSANVFSLMRARDVVWSGLNTVASSVGGVLPLALADVKLHQLARRRDLRAFVAVGRGLLLATPLVLVFGVLFMQADPVFRRLVRDVLRIDIEEVVVQVFVTGLVTWFVGGYLRGALVRGPLLATPDGPKPLLGRSEVGIILGALNLLFAAFVTVQLRYFFGGADLVVSTAGLTYAEYARSGFFELVFVSLLVLPVLLTGSAIVRREQPSTDRLFRILSATLIGLLFVVMYSAVARMRLYQATYGLTLDRLFATVFMAWLALVFVLFAATVIRRRARYFAAGVIATGLATLVGLNVVDPDALVVRVNAQRVTNGYRFDALYASTLSADAVPALVDALRAPRPSRPSVPGADPSEDIREITSRCAAVLQLLGQYNTDGESDWRRWKLSRARARAAVRAHEAALRRVSCWNGTAEEPFGYRTSLPTPAPTSR